MSYNGNSGYYRPGEAKKLIEQWLRNFPVETEFYYGTIAEECDVAKPTVSADLLKRVRTRNPTLRVGSMQGWYEKIIPADIKDDEEPQDDDEASGRNPAPGGILEVIGIARDGSLILRAENQSMWKAQEM